MKLNNKLEELYTLDEVAEYLKTDLSTVEKILDNYMVPVFFLDAVDITRISKSGLEQVVQEHTFMSIID